MINYRDLTYIRTSVYISEMTREHGQGASLQHGTGIEASSLFDGLLQAASSALHTGVKRGSPALTSFPFFAWSRIPAPRSCGAPAVRASVIRDRLFISIT